MASTSPSFGKEKGKYNCIITGAGGFVGQALASAMLSDPQISNLTLTDIMAPPLPSISKAQSSSSSSSASSSSSHVQTRCLAADLTDPSTCTSIFTREVNLVYLLHGIMSSQAEADLELGLRVNLDSTRMIVDHLRRTNPGVKVIFTGSTAVYGSLRSPGQGGGGKPTVTEWDAPIPGTSYGAQKHICEVLLDDFSRRGLLDGRVVRLPTVTVRPGKPTGAASSFASGIFREPLKGEKSILPVSRDTEVWICSPRTVVRNLIMARDIRKEDFGKSRIVNLPGVTVTVKEMLDALKAVGGEEALRLVEEKRDETTEKIVESWPSRFDTSKAESIGFAKGGSLIDTLKSYLEDYGAGTT